MTFTGGSWSFRYQVDNVKFNRLASAYVNHRRTRSRWAHRAWSLLIIGMLGLGLGVVVLALTSIIADSMFPKIENRDLSVLAWGVIAGVIAVGLLGCIRYLNGIVNIPKSNGFSELIVNVDSREISSRASGMTFSFKFESLKEFVELKSLFIFVHPLTVLVFIPRSIFSDEAMAEEFATFCRKALNDAKQI